MRPWAWEFVAGRPRHLTEYPLQWENWFRGSIEERALAVEEYEIEPFVFMARNGYLTDRELDAIRANAEEARPRIGTDAEHTGSGGIDWADRRRVKLYERVMEAVRTRGQKKAPRGGV